MKTRDLDEIFRANGCRVWYETPRHVYYLNPSNGRITAVPRLPELDDDFARDLAFQLGVGIGALSPQPRPRRR